MKLSARTAALALALLLGATFGVVAPAAYAHHSAAPFDFTKQVSVTGTVKSFEVLNPHSHIVLTVSDAKGRRDIDFEGHSASNFYRAGWRKNSVKFGDRITITIAPRRDGADGGFVMQFKDASGKVVGFGRQ